MILCYFTVALSLMPALAPSVSHVCHRGQPSAFAPLLLLQAVGAWRGAQSFCPAGFSAEPLQFAGTGIRQILFRTSCTACQWGRDSERTGCFPFIWWQFSPPFSNSRLQQSCWGSCWLLLSSPCPSPGMNTLQHVEQGGGKAWTGEIRWQENTVLLKPHFQRAQLLRDCIPSR